MIAPTYEGPTTYAARWTSERGDALDTLTVRGPVGRCVRYEIDREQSFYRVAVADRYGTPTGALWQRCRTARAAYGFVEREIAQVYSLRRR